jgi:phosphoribosylamine--glycine ligase
VPGAIHTSGGRVLAVTGLGADLRAAAATAYRAAEAIDWPGRFFRRDVGWRALG